MNKEDIIRMAKQAGYYTDDEDVYDGSNFFIHTKEITKFAELVAAHEREACAKVCEEMYDLHEEDWDYCVGLVDCAAAIRARGEK